VAAAFALWLLPAATAGAAMTFGPANNFAAGTEPRSVALGDFNRDGKLDLAESNQTSGTVAVLLGAGGGDFGPKTEFPTGGAAADSIALGDFNRDGKLDIVVSTESPGTVSVLLGTGSGSFGAATPFAIGGFVSSVAVGDFNGDGVPDLAVSNEITNNVSILLGTGSGSFGVPTDYGVGTTPFAIGVGDFNNDGNLDLAVANPNSNNVSILLGTGSGGFLAATDFSVGARPRALAIGDLNNDGAADLAVGNSFSDTVSVLLNAPTADQSVASLAFGSQTAVPQGAISAPLAVMISNEGSAPLVLRGLAFTGADPEDFLISADSCRAAIGPGAACSVSVRFAPQARGSRSATMTALTNAASDPAIALTGASGPLPQGPAGETGAVGAGGAAGTTGATGPRGRASRVVCKHLRRRGTKKSRIVCAVKARGARGAARS
jgi:hypothetical protein